MSVRHTSVRHMKLRHMLFGQMLFGQMLFGQMLFEQMLFGQMLFGQILFGQTLIIKSQKPIIYLFIVDRLNDECIVVKDATENIVCCHQSLFELNISFPENPVKGNPEDELNGESCIIILLILQWKPLNVITVNVISHY